MSEFVGHLIFGWGEYPEPPAAARHRGGASEGGLGSNQCISIWHVQRVCDYLVAASEAGQGEQAA